MFLSYYILFKSNPPAETFLTGIVTRDQRLTVGMGLNLVVQSFDWESIDLNQGLIDLSDLKSITLEDQSILTGD